MDVKKTIIVLNLPLLLFSCSFDNYSQFIESGFEQINNGDYCFTPRIKTAVKAKKTQPLSNVVFNVYPGAIKGFEEEWNNSYRELYKGNFYIKLRIFDLGELSDQFYFTLDDFPNEDKYLLTYKKSEGNDYILIPIFGDSVLYSMDFTKHKNKKSLTLGWYVTYCDEFGCEIYKETLNGFGGSDETYLHMSTNEEYVYFEEK